ncbi:MAG: SGNH/GDSL hydrolase family protein [Clostridia bacterium]|nr:SGNH/GDSL hydrolase family protein [Clostridia bacterium]
MEKLNVTILGDSLGKGMKIENGRPQKLKTNAVEILEKHYNIEINNNSCFGQTLKRIFEKNMVEDYLQAVNADRRNVVVFAVGGNDADFNWQAVAQSPYENQDPKTLEKEFENILLNLISKLKSKNIEVWICGIPPVNSENYFKNVIKKVADGDKVMQFFGGDISNIQRHQELYNMILFKVAMKCGCKFLDIRSPFLKIRNTLEFYAEDGVHPNEKGQEIIANQIIKILEKEQNVDICDNNIRNIF